MDERGWKKSKDTEEMEGEMMQEKPGIEWSSNTKNVHVQIKHEHLLQKIMMQPSLSSIIPEIYSSTMSTKIQDSFYMI